MAGGNDVGNQFTELALTHAHAAESLFHEACIHFRVEFLIGSSEGRKTAGEVIDLCITGMDAKFIFGLTHQHTVDEESLGAVLWAG